MTDSATALFTGVPFSQLAYAQRLATYLWEQHYKQDAPDWKPLEDMTGVLTQIDNMIVGLERPRFAEGYPVTLSNGDRA